MQGYKQPKKVQIVYFSGTGGTKLIADYFKKDFDKDKVVVRSHEIHKRSSLEYQPQDMLLLLYPVYAFNAPKPVYEFIDQLPLSEGTPAVIISVSGGGEITPNTASRVLAIKQLQKKGYRVVYERMLIMPSNIITRTPENISGMLLRVLPERVTHIVKELMAGHIRRTKPHKIDLLLYPLGRLEQKGAKKFGKHIKVDASSCNGCGGCANSCPLNNIRLDHNIPIFEDQCVMCLRCIYGCPRKALSPGFAKFFVLKGGYYLQNYTNHKADIKAESLPRKLGMGGVIKYLQETDN